MSRFKILAAAAALWILLTVVLAVNNVHAGDHSGGLHGIIAPLLL